MTQLSEETLAQLAEAVHRLLGLHFPPERWRDLARGVEATCRELGEAEGACTRRLLQGPSLDRRLVEILGRNLTVGETYFFREEAAFHALEEHFLPELVARRRGEGKTLRLWSAACASGEEPYSLAILLRTRIPDIDSWNASILATDVNTESLRRAEAGIYRQWSFRTTGDHFQAAWFTRTEGGDYQVRPEVRRLVRFAWHNLAEDPYPSLTTGTNGMDVIFCRNVLMYFSEKQRQKVFENLQRCLVDGGILVVGAAEAAARPGPGLTPVMLPGLVVYRRQPPAPRRGLTPAPTPPRARPAAGAPAPPAPPRPASLLPAVAAAFSRGDYATVCRLGSDLRADDTYFAAAALVIARACANLGNLPDALAWVEKVIAARRLDPDAHYLRAMILDELGRTAEALDALRTTLFVAPDFVPAHVALGNIFRRQNDRPRADRNFRNALLLLENLSDDDPVPHADEMSAGRLREVVMAVIGGTGGAA